MSEKLAEKLKNLLGNDRLLLDEPLSGHLSIKTGGKAKFFLMPRGKKELLNVLKILKEEELSYYILGNGTNVIAKDEGFNGAVICLKDKPKIKPPLASILDDAFDFNTLSLERNEGGAFIYAGAGVSLREAANFAYENSLCGMEALQGIPGSIGGALVMNAGAYGTEIKDVVACALALTEAGEVLELTKENLKFSYRNSVFSSNNMIALGAKFELKFGNKEEILLKMNELKKERYLKQPLEYPSCGSTFKRPQGHFAGKLISDCGLKGYRFGGASVSSKHAGFIVNDKCGSASDVLAIIEHVIKTVKSEKGVTLECEVKILE